MRQIACPLCDSTSSVPVVRLHDRLLGLDGQFTMVRCDGCGLHYLNPQPEEDELEQYYPEDYDPFATPHPDELPLPQRLSVRYGLHKRCRAVTRWKQGGQLLEIGCANGLFLDAMRRQDGWQVWGVEINESAVRYAREQLHLELFHGTLEEAAFPDGSFDTVVMWDVLEHLHQPRDALTEIRRVLKPDGLLCLRLPVLDSWDRRLFGPYWAGWDAPRHLTLFSRRTLSQMLARAGFRIQHTACIAGGYTTFALSLRFWARDHLSVRAQARLRRFLEALPVRLITAPYFYLVDRLGKCTVVTVFARPASHKTDRPGD
jgi:SAM-dependent methyltransferase